jgi:hypothetical protein
MNNLPKNYFIYETSYGSDIPVEQIYVHVFDALPSKHSSIKKYSSKIYDYFISNGFEQECEIVTETRRQIKPHNNIFLLHRTTKRGVLLKSTSDKSEDVYEITFYYDFKQNNHNIQFNQEEISKYEVVLKKSGINLIKSEMGHLDTEEYDLSVPDIDLELNYGKDFLKVHDLIVRRLNKPYDKGIILFHGEPGTGKTSYLKYLTRLIDNKEILFVPPSMAESMAEPSIIPFLMDHKNSVLIIEDAERVIADREIGNGSSVAVSNLLNLTDGILGDCLNIQIIATFNMKREKIDQALLRKGRLIAEHKFGKLSVNESNTLLKHLNKDVKIKEPMVLADIYNIEEELYKVENNKKIGF